MSVPSLEVVVIGAGVAGLSCASLLAEAGIGVEIWTAALPEHTTSSVAAAFWSPYLVEPLERVLPWAMVSYRRFATLVADPGTGVIWREALEVFPEPVPDPTWANDVDEFRPARPDELPPGHGYGYFFTGPVIDMSMYLPWLLAHVRAQGVRVIERRLDTLAPALAASKVVVNTTGLGARELVGDTRVFPVRGQVLLREQVGLERVMSYENGPGGITYIVPRGRDVILGGVADVHVEDLDENPEQTKSIAERCEQLEPRLRSARPLGVRVGLRPCRDAVRLEAETIEGRVVVHDYGHGGGGVTLSWGCAEEVRSLVLDAIATASSAARG